MNSHANRSGGTMAGAVARTIITRTSAAAAAIIATLAMLLCTLTIGAVQAHAAEFVSGLGEDASADANVHQALLYMKQLNELRASSRTPLTAQQIIDAQNADNDANMQAGDVADDTADGKYVPPVRVNQDMMKWAQTRANELVQLGTINHSNMYNGVPSWYVHGNNDHNLFHSSAYIKGYLFGPEALAYASTSAGGPSGNAIDAWASELTAAPGDDRQGYGHYLTEVSRLANIAGIGIAVKGELTITVLEIGNDYQGDSVNGGSQSVEDALSQYGKSITAVTAPSLTVASSRTKPTSQLPQRVDVTYDDGTSSTAAVTWDEIPNDWNTPRSQHTVTIHGNVDGYAAGVDLTMTVSEASPESVKPVDANGATPAVTTVAGKAPDLSGIVGQVTWTNGETSDDATITWNQSDLAASRFATVGDKVTVGGTWSVMGQHLQMSGSFSIDVTVVAAVVRSVKLTQDTVTTESGTAPDLSQVKAKVTYVDGTTNTVDVKWDEPAKADYSKREGGTFTVHGTADVGGTSHDVTVTVDVTPATVESTKALPDDQVETPAGVDPTPKLPKTAKVTWSNGDVTEEPITWQKIPSDRYDMENDVFSAAGWAGTNSGEPNVFVNVKVNAPEVTDVTMEPTEVTTKVGVSADLSQVKAKVTYTTGTSQLLDVDWDSVDYSKYETPGSFKVNGTVWGVDHTFTVTVHVVSDTTEPTVKSVTVSPDVVETTVGTQPTLPQTAKVTWSNGDTTNESIAWNPVDVSKAGTIKATGKVSVGGGTHDVTVTVTVKEKPATAIKFKDVVSSTPHAEDIQWLGDNGISTGWKQSDGTYVFAPMNEVIRQDMAAFLYRLAGSPAYTPSAADKARFTDVTDSTPHAKEIWWLASEGISQGFQNPDGKTWSFGGDRMVVRQDMAAFLHKLAVKQDAKPALGQGVTFTDLAGASHVDDIQWLAKTGVTTGWKMDDGSYQFRGMNVVVRQDMAAFLHRMSTNVLKK